METLQPHRRFIGKTAVITGAASGIGRSIAVLMAAEGAHIVALDRDIDGMSGLLAGLKASGATAEAMPLDLADIANVQAVAARIEALDILVNSAGISQLREWDRITVEDWDRVMDINLKGLFFLTQGLAHRMVAQKSGRIVNIASVGAKRGGLLTAHYGASKAGVINLTRSFSLALAPHGITVNAVCPGYVETALTQSTDRDSQAMGWKPGERSKDLVKRIPLGRVPDVSEVASAALFYASDDASYITGQSMNVDGGVVND